jgi:Protein of unknown function (DUF3489)
VLDWPALSLKENDMAILNPITTSETDEPGCIDGLKPTPESGSEGAAITPRRRGPKSQPVQSAEATSTKEIEPSSRPAEKSKKPEASKETKAEQVLKKLRNGKGATIEMLMQATGWQGHSVRGFLSGTVKKRMKLPLITETGKDGVRRYRIDDSAKVA